MGPCTQVASTVPSTYIRTTFRPKYKPFGYMDPFTRIASLMYLKNLFLVSVITGCLWALMSVSLGRARMEMRGVETYFRV